MKKIWQLLSDRIWRFYAAMLMAWGLVLFNLVMLMLFIMMPESRKVFIWAAASWIGLILMIFYSHVRLVKGYLYPLSRIEEYAERISEGNFPPPLNVVSRNLESYRGLVRSLNQMRDRLRYLVSHSSMLQQQQNENIKDLTNTTELYACIMAMLGADLRTPVNALAGYAFLLERNADNDNTAHLAAEIMRNCREAENLLLHMTEIGAMTVNSGNDEEAGSFFNTAVFARSIADDAGNIFSRISVPLKTHFSPNLPGRIYCDQHRLRKLLLLMTNIAKANAVSGSKAEFLCERREDNLVFTVRASGRPRDISLALLYEECRENDTVHAGMKRDILALRFVASQAERINAVLDVSAWQEDGVELSLALKDIAGRRAAKLSPTTHISEQDSKEISSEDTGGDSAGFPAASDMPSRVLLAYDDRDFAGILAMLMPDSEVTLLQFPEELPEDIGLFDIAIAGIDPFKTGHNKDEFRLIEEAVANRVPVLVVMKTSMPELEQQLRQYGVGSVMTQVLDYRALLHQIAALKK